MALVTLVSAAGSPGVTTTGLGLALCWPRPVVLVEADPAGSSALAAGYFRGRLIMPVWWIWRWRTVAACWLRRCHGS